MLFAIVASLVWVPASLAGSVTTGSDVGEHFRLLHAIEGPGWTGWSANRYPLPALLAHGICRASDPHGCWYEAGVVSMGLAGAGIFLWGRAIGGRGVGAAALILAGALQDLAVLSHTVTGYPEILALWCLAAGFSAYAVRAPSLPACLLAGIGTAGAFASDGRGLMIGLAALGVTAVAVARCRGWRRVLIAGALAGAPIVGAWTLQSRLPVQFSSLEQLVEASVEVSWTRAGLDPPPRVQNHPRAWVWGRSLPQDLPTILQNLRSSRARLRPGAGEHPEQRFAVSRMRPLWGALALLSLGLLPLLRDPRVWLALGPGAAFLAIYQSTMTIEYHARYAALGAPLLLVAAAAGLRGWSGRGAPWWVPVGIAAALALAPGPLSWWDRQPKVTAPPELRACIAVLRGEAGEVDNAAVRECLDAQRRPLTGDVRWP